LEANIIQVWVPTLIEVFYYQTKTPLADEHVVLKMRRLQKPTRNRQTLNRKHEINYLNFTRLKEDEKKV
jgi:hypothetical protein